VDLTPILQQIAEGLTKRGFFVPNEWWTNSIVDAVFNALDSKSKAEQINNSDTEIADSLDRDSWDSWD
jgi:hypothetical protein